MVFFSTVPFIRFTIALIIGIITAYYWPNHHKLVGIILSIGVPIYIIGTTCAPAQSFYYLTPWLGFLGFSCIGLIGFLNVWLYQADHMPNHLVNYTFPLEAYQGIIKKKSNNNPHYTICIVAVDKIRKQGIWYHVQGKVKLHIKNQSNTQPLISGQRVLIKGSPKIIDPPLNPYEFNHQKNLQCINVYHHHFIRRNQLIICTDASNLNYTSLNAYIHTIRNYCKSILIRYIPDNISYHIMLALLLGVQDALDESIRNLYATTGTLHIFSISGLHVGILYGFIIFLFSAFKKRKWIIPHLITLIIVWIYAFTTDLAPAVLRATIMLTLITTSRILHHPYNIYNILGISAFILLLINPYLVFCISFQLSYLAFLGILYLQPKIYSWIQFNNPIMNKSWITTTLSLAAQLATTPLNLYYFHQFPSYFVIANWIAVPLLFVLLCLGFLLLIFSFWPFITYHLGFTLMQCIQCTNKLLLFIESLPGSICNNIYTEKLEVCTLYMIGIVIFYSLKHRKYRHLFIAHLMMLGVALYTVQKKKLTYQQKKIIFYSIPKQHIIAFIQSNFSTLYYDPLDDRAINKLHTYYVQPGELAMGINKTKQYTFNEADQDLKFPLKIWNGMKIAVWHGKKILFLNKKSIQHIPKFKNKIYVDSIVVEKETPHTLQWIQDNFLYSKIVLYLPRSKTHLLSTKGKEAGVCYHSLHHQGALIVDG